MLVETTSPAGSSRAIVAFAVVALLAWARNDAGVDDRDPDPRKAPKSSSSDDRATGTEVVARPDPPTTWTTQHDGRTGASGPRPPSFLDALAPVLVLIGLLTLTIVLFGTAAADGPLQVALFTSAVFAGLVAFKNGYTAANLREAAIGGISSAMGALFILLAVGALIGTWNMAGTIPTVVSYGIAILKPAIFYAAVALICAVVGAVTGSSWTTAGTLGVAFIGMAPILGLSTTIAAGAIISGAYMGDKMSPLSETTVLVPSLVGGVTVNEHIRGMLWTVVPSFVLAFVVFVVIGVVDDPASSAVGTDAARDVLATAFNISPLNLLPLAVLIAVTLWRVPPFLAIYAVALFSGILACFTQRDAVEAFVDEPGQGTAADQHRGDLPVDGDGLRVRERQRDDRRPVLTGRHGQHADHRLADPRRDVLRRDHGRGRLPQPADRPPRARRPLRPRPDQLGRRHRGRSQRRGR